ncbi:Uncharacterised protein [Trueperella bialowiezensis]|uniref:Uncharacterized protein n=1 Tax=Trueperella bialowiezensis TaxID=312285 RepID=A0A3S4WH67_9ACTO|nr:Uncharacterised protein [Trueperella bialowiezensis]
MALDEREKLAIRRMRTDGLGYKAIANRLAVGRDQVRAYLLRTDTQPQGTVDEQWRWCRWCGERLPARADGKKPRFCCTEHRRAFWKHHPDEGNRKAFYAFTCAHCDTGFSAYGNKSRKYCSHACYIRHRFATKGGKR